MEEILENPTTSPEVILIPENLTITQVVILITKTGMSYIQKMIITQVVILGNLITILEEILGNLTIFLEEILGNHHMKIVTLLEAVRVLELVWIGITMMMKVMKNGVIMVMMKIMMKRKKMTFGDRSRSLDVRVSTRVNFSYRLFEFHKTSSILATFASADQQLDKW